MASQRKRVFVVNRIQRNVNGPLPPMDRETIWLTMMMCLLSSVQRSNPDSPITRFLLSKPFPISLSACTSAADVESFAREKIAGFGGIRFAPKISKQISHNLAKLQNGGWKTLENHLADSRPCEKGNPA